MKLFHSSFLYFLYLQKYLTVKKMKQSDKKHSHVDNLHTLLGFKSKEKIPQDVYNENMKDLFKAPYDQNIMPYDEGQNVKEFLDMEEETNSEGTGRFRFQKSGRNKIMLYFVGKQPEIEKIIDSNVILQAFKAFFSLETIYVEFLEFFNFEKRFKGKRISIIDQKKQLEFPLKQRGGRVGVFSLFDVLVEYIQKKSYTNVFFVDEDIIEEDNPDFNLVGRACGDRICIVSLKNISTYEVISTSLHECLHTFGIDHCIYFDCIMNSMYQQDQFWMQLCPVDLVKLQSELKFDIKQRYQNLKNFYQNIFKDEKQVEFLTSVLKSLE
ncbi:hypothetical protein ABPG72_012683 [Tetrahymena utriculariae]